jgi:hypothetical protein
MQQVIGNAAPSPPDHPPTAQQVRAAVQREFEAKAGWLAPSFRIRHPTLLGG